MWLIASVIFSTLYLLTNRRYRWIYIIYKTFRRDLKAFIRFATLHFHLWIFERYTKTVAKQFLKNLKRHPQKVAIFFENEKWTLQDVEEYSNKVAHYFKNQGYKRGDTVGLFMANRPEYTCIWLGLSKIGVVTALINTNLVADPLVHCITISNAKGLIYGDDLSSAISQVSQNLSNIKLYQFNDGEVLENACKLKTDLEKETDAPLTEDLKKGSPRDKLILIYTSGTTGLPKAALISHLRYALISCGLYFMMDLRENDVLYVPLPLYHSAGGIIGIGQCLLHGLTVVIRKKFSASNFWIDCKKHKCTAAQYIGEICRYLLAVHGNRSEPPAHSIRLMFGNGLRPQIWNRFVTQFRIGQIYEFYGATEGNSNLINIDGQVGAVGFIPRYASSVYPVYLIKCDENTGEPIRNSEGLCIHCEPGEEGIFIGKISPKKTTSNFEGYANRTETEKKIIKNVFEKGDLYFNSGDVLVQDEFGYFYFKDRTGDTFRWKGENVSTAEVEAVISNIVGLNDCTAYGVEIPHTDGRAGMVAIVDVDDTIDLDKMYQSLKATLPAYAIPYFIRIVKSLPMTGTFKIKKTDLQKEGFDVDKIKEFKDHHLFFLDVKKGCYVELTREIYNDIISGKIRL